MMNSLQPFQQFGVRAEVRPDTDNFRAVVYTRVSSKAQADHNASLETQLKACLDFLNRQGYTLVEAFGGTYESANSTNRKEFKRMLAFVRKRRNKVSHVIVYSPDRFSRNLEEGTRVINELKRMGIRLHTVTQSVDDETPSGKLHRQIQMAFSEYDNQLRRDKCMTGVINRLEKGGFCSQAPFGYDNITRNGTKTITPNKDAIFIRTIFELKAYDRLPNTQIIEKLVAMGCKRLYRQHMHKIIGNPVYCGLIRHQLLDGRVVEGVHEAIVSKELFLLANEVAEKTPHGYKWDKEQNHTPLKRFLCCAECGRRLTAYQNKAKKLYYYKCNTPGCKVSKSAKKLNAHFRELLSFFHLDPALASIAKKQLIATWKKGNKDKAERVDFLKRNRAQIVKKLERLEERFVEEEISKELYEKYQAKYEANLAEIDLEMDRVSEKLSNPRELIQFATEIGQNIAKLWDSGVANLRQRIQEMVFPDGLAYDKESNKYLTPRINTIFALFSQITLKTGYKKSGQPLKIMQLSAYVEDSGVEPLTS